MTTMTNMQNGRWLVPEDLFQKLVRRVVDDDGYDAQLAERVVDQALAFLGTCARNHGGPLSPSRTVDPGWHAFVLHTREYREFCRRIAGRFIDHVPASGPPSCSGEHAMALRRTVTAIRSAGYAVDDELWVAGSGAGCTGCYNGCHDDPPPVRVGG